jgi:hypothetical protein
MGIAGVISENMIYYDMRKEIANPIGKTNIKVDHKHS